MGARAVAAGLCRAPLALPSHALIINEIAIVALLADSAGLSSWATPASCRWATPPSFGLGGYAARAVRQACDARPAGGAWPWALVPGSVLGAVASLTIMRSTDLTRLMVTLGVGLVMLELANKLDWLTAGADGLQGVMMGPVLGQLSSTCTWAHGRVVFAHGAAGVLLSRPPSCSRPWLLLKAIPRQPAARHGHRHPGDGKLAQVYAARCAGWGCRRAAHQNHGLLPRSICSSSTTRPT